MRHPPGFNVFVPPHCQARKTRSQRYWGDEGLGFIPPHILSPQHRAAAERKFKFHSSDLCPASACHVICDVDEAQTYPTSRQKSIHHSSPFKETYNTDDTMNFAAYNDRSIVEGLCALLSTSSAAASRGSCIRGSTTTNIEPLNHGQNGSSSDGAERRPIPFNQFENPTDYRQRSHLPVVAIPPSPPSPPSSCEGRSMTGPTVENEDGEIHECEAINIRTECLNNKCDVIEKRCAVEDSHPEAHRQKDFGLTADQTDGMADRPIALLAEQKTNRRFVASMDSLSHLTTKSGGGGAEGVAAQVAAEVEEDNEGGDDKPMQAMPDPLQSCETFRINYLRKLSYASIWLPMARRPPKHQTIVIFDWDDTLLCTSYINQNCGDVVTAMAMCGDEAAGARAVELRHQMRDIENYAISLLETARRMGLVFIITNAMHGWVEFSAKKYLPNLHPILQKIPTISARQRYETIFPGECDKWKIQCFLEVQRSLNNQIVTNLIAVGDSTIEMDAILIMGREFSHALIKSIKFRDSPTPEELARQLRIVALKFERICSSANNLRIGLKKKEVEGTEQ